MDNAFREYAQEGGEPSDVTESATETESEPEDTSAESQEAGGTSDIEGVNNITELRFVQAHTCPLLCQ